MKILTTTRITLLLSLGLALAFTACQDDSGNEKELSFDQQAMLTNIGQNVIFPNYANFKTKTNSLQQAVNSFSNQPDTETLSAARQALKEAYGAWQHVSLYEFGPAESLALRANVNSFPTHYSKANANQINGIEDDIRSGSWNLSFFSSLEKKGLPALDYLLFSGADADETLNAFTSAEHAAKRREYLQDVANDLNKYAENVYKGWAPDGDNYLGTFSTTTGNSAGSPLSLLVNQFNQGYERLKNNRIGIPLGIRSVDGEPIPRAVEAYFSGISLALAQKNLQSVKNTYKGEANGVDGIGLDDYLNAIYQAGNIQEDLNAEILGQLQMAQNVVAAIPAPLSEAVVNNKQLVNTAYTELQNLVVLIKTDMPSALGVLISYFDNDGD